MIETLREISGLAEVADRYDGVICDLWGVLHNGRAVFPDALDALTKAKGHDMEIVFLSNAPRPSSAVVTQLTSFGLDRALYRGVVTSGDATRIAIETERYGTRFWHIGPERDLPLFDGLALQRVAQDDAEFIVCTGPYDDTRETAADYTDRFAAAIECDLILICANPDLAVIRGDTAIACAGALAALYRDMGGKAVSFGKPDREVFDIAVSKLDAPRERIVMIGDGLKTDISGAKNAGLDALLVAGGMHAAVLGANRDPLDTALIAGAAAEDGGSPKFVLKNLRW